MKIPSLTLKQIYSPLLLLMSNSPALITSNVHHKPLCTPCFKSSYILLIPLIIPALENHLWGRRLLRMLNAESLEWRSPQQHQVWITGSRNKTQAIKNPSQSGCSHLPRAPRLDNVAKLKAAEDSREKDKMLMSWLWLVLCTHGAGNEKLLMHRPPFFCISWSSPSPPSVL